MIRVVANPAHPPSSPVQSPPHAVAFEAAVGEPELDKPLLTQKQVRELRRLCRKTANRAEFEDRLIQIRQIASIAAMGTPAAQFFDPQNTTSGAALRAWVELHRQQGADWRDERPLADDAIDELRRWDRGLKAWARLRFETTPTYGPVHTQLSSSGNVSRSSGLASSSPITPYSVRTTKTNSEPLQFYSPLSPDVQGYSSTRSPEPPASQPSVQQNEKGAVQQKEEVVRALVAEQSPGRGPGQGEEAVLDVCIDRVGDTINITVPAKKISLNTADPLVSQQPRRIGLNDQENVYPSNIKRLPLHAANTAKSWRNPNNEASNPEYLLSVEKEIALSSATKMLFSAVPNDSATNGVAATQRTAKDWSKLRRRPLATLSANNVVRKHNLQKTAR